MGGTTTTTKTNKTNAPPILVCRVLGEFTLLAVSPPSFRATAGAFREARVVRSSGVLVAVGAMVRDAPHSARIALDVTELGK